MFVLASERLLLRDFTEADLDPFIALSQDDAIFTYTKGRRTGYSTRKELFLRLLTEPALTPKGDLYPRGRDVRGLRRVLRDK